MISLKEAYYHLSVLGLSIDEELRLTVLSSYYRILLRQLKNEQYSKKTDFKIKQLEDSYAWIKIHFDMINQLIKESNQSDELLIKNKQVSLNNLFNELSVLLMESNLSNRIKKIYRTKIDLLVVQIPYCTTLNELVDLEKKYDELEELIDDLVNEEEDEEEEEEEDDEEEEINQKGHEDEIPDNQIEKHSSYFKKGNLLLLIFIQFPFYIIKLIVVLLIKMIKLLFSSRLVLTVIVIALSVYALSFLSPYIFPDTYLIDYELNGGINHSSNRSNVVLGNGFSLNSPSRVGFTFEGWFIDEGFTDEVLTISDTNTEDITVYAKWLRNQYTISFLNEAIDPLVIEYDSPISLPSLTRSDADYFAGWYHDLVNLTEFKETKMPANDINLSSLWLSIPMVSVGDDRLYSVPTGIDDSSIESVQGGFSISTTETTYDLWFYVYLWGKTHGYTINHKGAEGHDGYDQDYSLSNLRYPSQDKYEPVTKINFRDIIVWLNALSEMTGRSPVYRDESDNVLKNSRDLYDVELDNAIQSQNNGFRLPSANEWEMAARWTNVTSNDYNEVFVGDRYWLPGNYVSGGNSVVSQEFTYDSFAWFNVSGTSPVAQKLPNALGLYDMSGNVAEWTFSKVVSSRIVKGGSWTTWRMNPEAYLAFNEQLPENNFDDYTGDTGFRIVLNNR